ncbi:solute carrier family 66 member 3 [Hetaerina americana]|uniref:solute carrier family 66 member 3 n=1 Tax=Hetaerina americana TaxID=62018 RepID=UPI003A7F220A
MGEYYGILQAISDILSVITITLCLVLKVPQILNLMKVKSAKGISMNGLMLELSSYSVMASYNYCNGYALLSYMEYPIIIFQEIILIFLVLKYMDLLNVISAGLFGIYAAVFGGFIFGLFPPQILTMLVPLTTPVSASSKVVQLLAILRAKDSRSISTTTWALSAFTNLTRVYTIYMDSADLNLLSNFGISVLLSSSILAAAIYYKNPQMKEKAQ